MKTTTNYKIQIKGVGFSFPQDSYSKFYKRLSLRLEKYPKMTVYGLEQAREHVQQLRRHVFDGKRIYANLTFEIVKIETVESVEQTLTKQSKH